MLQAMEHVLQDITVKGLVRAGNLKELVLQAMIARQMPVVLPVQVLVGLPQLRAVHIKLHQGALAFAKQFIHYLLAPQTATAPVEMGVTV